MATTKNSAGNNSKKSNSSSPEEVSTGCFRFKSFLSLCRSSSQRHLVARPSPAPPPAPARDPRPVQNPASSSSLQINDGEVAAAEAANAYWRRARELEEEVRKLEEWLAMDKRLAGGAAVEMVKLSDGSYLREIRKLGRPWGALAMQVSAPLVAENAATAAEVIRGMTPWGRAALSKHMKESMPMRDLRGRQREQIKGQRVAARSEDASTEAEGLLLTAMEEMEGLVLEGLRIQMGSSGGEGAASDDDDDQVAEEDEEEEEEEKGRAVERRVLVMLVQVRDPEERHAAVGEAMIGLIEAAAASGDGRYGVQGVHIAGMKRGSGEGRDFIWSTSSRGCKGSQDGGGGGGCMQYVRNPDRFFHTN